MTTAVDFNLFSTTPPLRNFPCLNPPDLKHAVKKQVYLLGNLMTKLYICMVPKGSHPHGNLLRPLWAGAHKEPLVYSLTLIKTYTV